ncbi:polysaccharide deacetylase family protein [Cytobacillus citreus]|uniref:polysaccharide deacetylase family protein n=1 Tax=Cytobacillus citreus TaxID=2833586 RepID=UPI003B83891C
MKPNGKYIALTFDDGPSPKITPLILDIFKEQHNALYPLQIYNDAKIPIVTFSKMKKLFECNTRKGKVDRCPNLIQMKRHLIEVSFYRDIYFSVL